MTAMLQTSSSIPLHFQTCLLKAVRFLARRYYYMADRLNSLQNLGTDLSMGTSQLPGRDVLDRTTLRVLNIRSDRHGLLCFLGHCLTILATGGLVYALRGAGVLLVPAMILHGFALMSLFAPMHECVHRTAFRSRWLNRVIGWIAGAASFYNRHYWV